MAPLTVANVTERCVFDHWINPVQETQEFAVDVVVSVEDALLRLGSTVAARVSIMLRHCICCYSLARVATAPQLPYQDILPLFERS